MNVLTLPDLYARLRELGIPANRIMLHNILQQPESFNVKVLSHELKNKAKQGLYDYANVLPEHEKTAMLQQIAPLIDFMYTDTHTDENSLRGHFNFHMAQQVYVVRLNTKAVLVMDSILTKTTSDRF